MLMARRVQLRLDDEVGEIIEHLKQKYPVGACEIHPTDHCYFNRYSHWILDRPKLVVWAGQIVSSPRSIPSTRVTVLLLQKITRATFFTPPLLAPAFMNGKAKEIKVTSTPTLAPNQMPPVPAPDPTSILAPNPMPPFTGIVPYQPTFPNPGVQNPSLYPFVPPPTLPWTYPQPPFSGFYPGNWPQMAPPFMPPFGTPYHHPQAYTPYPTYGGGHPGGNPYV